MDLSFIFPCLNEAETLKQCIDEVRTALERTKVSFEIIVADNGSDDGSDALAMQCGAKVVHEARRGYGAAITAGIRAAEGNYIAFADADGSYPLQHIGTLYEKAVTTGADMVIGSRFQGEIESGAPVRIGQYAKSWKVKTTEESSQKLVQTVYSPTRYMLAHLLEKGHAKRGGGRVAGKPHIAPAEAAGVKQLESLIEKALKG